MSEIWITPLADLSKTLDHTEAQDMVSLMGPGQAINQPAQIIGQYCALEFNDISRHQSGLISPSPGHIAALLETFKQWNGAKPLIAQCWMGISRSTAAAVICAAAKRPELEPAAIAAALRAASPYATPNPMMIALADDALGYGGKLITAIAAIGRGAETGHGVPFRLDLSGLNGRKAT